MKVLFRLNPKAKRKTVVFRMNPKVKHVNGLFRTNLKTVHMKGLFGANPEAMRMKGNSAGLIKLANSHKNKSLRTEALMALGYMKSPKLIPVAITLFTDSDPIVRDAASRALALVGAPAAPYLLGLYTEKKGMIAELSHQTLVRMGETAVPFLIKSLGFLPVNGKERAVFTLVEIGEPAIPSLMHSLGDENVVIRDLAEVALNKIGQPAIIHLVKGLNSTDTEIQARSATILIMKGLEVVPYIIASMSEDTKDSRSIKIFILKEIGDAVFEPLIEALRSQDPVIKTMTIDAFTGYGTSSIQPLLQEMLLGTPDSSSAAGNALISFGSDATEPLAVKIQKSDAHSRIKIANVMKKVGEPSIPLLIQLIHHENTDVVETASDTLEGIGPCIVGYLIQDGTGKDPAYVQPIRSIIHNIGNNIVPQLEDIVRQDNPEKTVFALQMMQEIDPLLCGDVVIHALYSSSPDVRDEAVRSLSKMASSFSPRLIKLLSDPSDDVVMRVQSVIVQKGSDAVPYLLKEISKASDKDSKKIEFVIREIGEGALPVLITAVQDDTPEAVSAMTIIANTGPAAIQHILPLISDKNHIASSNATTLIQMLFRKSPDGCIRELAYHSHASDQDTIYNLLEEQTDDLISILIKNLHTRDETVSEWCSSLLVASGENTVLPLIESLRSCEESYGLLVTSILVQIGIPCIIPLVEAIRDPDVHLYAAAALGMIGEPAIKPLIPLLYETDESVVAVAGLALGKIGETALPHLLPLFFSDIKLSKTIGGIFREIGAAAIPPLLLRMKEKQETSTRQYAILIATIISVGLSDQQSLFELFAISDKKTASIIGNSIGLHGAAVVSQLLESLAAYGNDIPLIVSAAIAKIGSDAILPISEEIKKYPLSDHHRIPLIHLLSRIGDNRALPLLRECFKSPDEKIRTAVISSLLPYGLEATDLLIMAMNDTLLIRQAGVVAMGYIGLPVLDHLLSAMKDSHTEIRSAAVAAIAKIGLPAQYMLIQMLSDENRQVRRDASTLLQGMNWEPKYVTDKLTYLYASEDWEGLIAIGPSAIEILENGLHDSDLEIREKTKMCLQSIQEKPYS